MGRRPVADAGRGRGTQVRPTVELPSFTSAAGRGPALRVPARKSRSLNPCRPQAGTPCTPPGTRPTRENRHRPRHVHGASACGRRVPSTANALSPHRRTNASIIAAGMVPPSARDALCICARRFAAGVRGVGRLPPHTGRAKREDGERERQGVLAARKPTSKEVLAGESEPSRTDERAKADPWYHEPPRNTLFAPLAGPDGFIKPEFEL